MSSIRYRARSSTSVVLVCLATLAAACGPAPRGEARPDQPARIIVRDIDFEVEKRYQLRDNVHEVSTRDEQRDALSATRTILARGWELGCFPYGRAADAHRYYGDEEIAFMLPAGLSIPAPGRLRVRRTTARQLEEQAQRDCIARPLWIVEPIELFYTPRDRTGRLFGVYCKWGYTKAGVPQREYPARSRRYYVRVRDDGVIEIERTPLEYPHYPPFPEHVARRKQECRGDPDQGL